MTRPIFPQPPHAARSRGLGRTDLLLGISLAISLLIGGMSIEAKTAYAGNAESAAVTALLH